MYILSPTYELQILKPYYSRVREKAMPYTTNTTYLERRHIPSMPW
jgi:hypothetical protein